MRKLASVRRITAIKPHLNADALELAVVDGWTCVVKKGEFTAGSLAAYFEIDSFLPTALAPFLTKPGKEPKVFEGVEGERLRSIRLRGELSQGLLLPMCVLPPGTYYEGTDLTEILNIKKWEPPISPTLAGNARGGFPSFIRKTDQERIQNIFHKLTDEEKMDQYEVTLKLDGSSATYYVKDGEVGVCSRNLELKVDEDNAENSFVKMFLQLGLDKKLKEFHEKTGRNIALQGELFGAGINGNWEGIPDHRYSIFDVYDIDEQRYTQCYDRHAIIGALGLEHVPGLGYTTLEGANSVEDFLRYADRESIYNKVAEGVVFKSMTNPDFSFKVINTKYLLNGGE